VSHAEVVLMPFSDVVSPDDVPITDEQEFRGGKCTECGALSIPRAVICPTCNSTVVEMCLIQGTGVLYSYTTVYSSATFPTPYTVGYVDLDSGLRVLGQVLESAESIECDARVTVHSTSQSPTGWGFSTGKGAKL
jgi:uncharacterized OB-fold protein